MSSLLSSHVSLWGSHPGHNKFIVLLSPDGTPIAVWYFPQRPFYLQPLLGKVLPRTGSTNITAGAIFGHSNVGHIVTQSKPQNWRTFLTPLFGFWWRDKARYLPEVLEVLGKAYWRPWEEGLTFQTDENTWDAVLMPNWDYFLSFLYAWARIRTWPLSTRKPRLCPLRTHRTIHRCNHVKQKADAVWCCFSKSIHISRRVGSARCSFPRDCVSASVGRPSTSFNSSRDIEGENRDPIWCLDMCAHMRFWLMKTYMMKRWWYWSINVWYLNMLWYDMICFCLWCATFSISLFGLLSFWGWAEPLAFIAQLILRARRQTGWHTRLRSWNVHSPKVWSLRWSSENVALVILCRSSVAFTAAFGIGSGSHTSSLTREAHLDNVEMGLLRSRSGSSSVGSWQWGCRSIAEWVLLGSFYGAFMVQTWFHVFR